MAPDQSAPQPQSRLLIVHTKYFNVDKLIATVVLGRIIASSTDSEVDIYTGNSDFNKAVSELISTDGIQFMEQAENRNFVITLKRDPGVNVSNVKWQQQGDKIKLVIYTESGSIDGTKDIVMDQELKQYSHVYTLGIDHQQDLDNLLGDDKKLYHAAKNRTNLNLGDKAKPLANAQNIISNKPISYAQLVLRYALKQQWSLSERDATDLTSCVYWRTNSLRNNLTNQIVMEDLLELSNQRANLEAAAHQIYRTKRLPEAKAATDIYNNMRITNYGIAISQVNTETVAALANVYAINPDKNPLFSLQQVLASFVLVPTQKNETLVFASSHHHQLDINKIFAKHKFTGDQLQGELTMKLPLAEAKQEIETKLATIIEQKNLHTKSDKIATAKSNKQPTKQSAPAEISRQQKKQKPTQQKPPKPETKKQEQAENPAPLSAATESINPEPAPYEPPPKPLFGGLSSGGGGGNPFGPK